MKKLLLAASSVAIMFAFGNCSHTGGHSHGDKAACCGKDGKCCKSAACCGKCKK